MFDYSWVDAESVTQLLKYSTSSVVSSWELINLLVQSRLFKRISILVFNAYYSDMYALTSDA